MTPWACGIEGCGEFFDTAEDLIRHQITDHASCECAVCGEQLPAGYVAIRHTFDEHTRADYVRAYDADSDDIRHREQVKELVERELDVDGLLDSLAAESQPAVSLGD